MSQFTVILPTGYVLLKNEETGQTLRLSAEDGPLILGTLSIAMQVAPAPMTRPHVSDTSKPQDGLAELDETLEAQTPKMSTSTPSTVALAPGVEVTPVTPPAATRALDIEREAMLNTPIETLKANAQNAAAEHFDASAMHEAINGTFAATSPLAVPVSEPGLTLLRDKAPNLAEPPVLPPNTGMNAMSPITPNTPITPIRANPANPAWSTADLPEWDQRAVAELPTEYPKDRAYIPVLDAPFEALTLEDFERTLEAMANKRNNLEGDMEYLEEIQADEADIDEIAAELDALDDEFAQVILRKEAFEKAGKPATTTPTHGE